MADDLATDDRATDDRATDDRATDDRATDQHGFDQHGFDQHDFERRLEAELRTVHKQTEVLHDSYRALLAKRQIEFDRTMSEVSAKHQDELRNERRRHESIVNSHRDRRDLELDIARRQAADEVETAYRALEKRLTRDLAHATATVQRLERELQDRATEATRAEALADEHRLEIDSLRSQLEASTTTHQTMLDEIRKQLDVATHRLEAERKRSAATLAELLERSASIASEADRARAEAAAVQARAERNAEDAHSRAQADYAELATTAFERETELEALVADLRAELGRQART